MTNNTVPFLVSGTCYLNAYFMFIKWWWIALKIVSIAMGWMIISGSC